MTIQNDLKRLEKWAQRNLMSFKKRKCKVLLLRQNNLMHQHKLGVNWLESSSVENDLRVLGT